MTKISLEWRWSEADRTWTASVPAKDYRGQGFYHIHAIQRQPYCDRGKWHVLVDHQVISPLDHQEGFPRYFFKLEHLKEEMELWANARQEVRDAHPKS